jgi:hypothetical protein
MTQIKPTYVTFEQAKKLKEKEFNVPTQWAFDLKGQDYKDEHWDIDYNCCTYNCYSKPEQWQVVEWLRVVHGIWINIDWSMTKWGYFIVDFKEETLKKVCKDKDWRQRNSAVYLKNQFDFNSPQEAYSAAFDYVLNNLI